MFCIRSSYNLFYRIASRGSQMQNINSHTNYSYIQPTNPQINLQKLPMVKQIYLYNNLSPDFYLIQPSLEILKNIFIPYVRKSNNYYTSLLVSRTINMSTINLTYLGNVHYKYRRCFCVNKPNTLLNLDKQSRNRVGVEVGGIL